jgi:hypothetical protein
MKHASWIAAATLLLSACTRGGPSEAQVIQDFDAICKAQRDYVSSRALMKTAENTELLTERNRRLSEARQTEAGIKAVDAILSAGAGSARAKVETAAASAGLKGWACPEL